ncbi:MAG: FG-GAP repeat protein [Proteobacteria bacterium]|nr:FG-GAP repeat protein [Pseudomonadota bacterium]
MSVIARPGFLQPAVSGPAVYLLLLSGLLLAGLALAPSPALAASTRCQESNYEGDRAGHSLAVTADFDGDGIPDVAVGLPCRDRLGAGLVNAGAARVYSGSTGRVVFRANGSQDDQHLGEAVAFIDDIDGDGAAELAVGSGGWDVAKPAGGSWSGAGKVTIYSSSGSELFTLEGSSGDAGLGSVLQATPDLTGDGLADLLVGAPLAKDMAQEKTGALYLLSVATGAVVDTAWGLAQWDRWGSAISARIGGDMDGDGVADVIVGAHLADNGWGMLRVLSGANFASLILELEGSSSGENTGKALQVTGDLDGDGLADFAVGAPGADTGGLNKSGIVRLFSATGSLIRELAEPVGRVDASFGKALAGLGDVNDDGVADMAVAAPEKIVNGNASAGAVHVFSGADGSLLWSREGARVKQRMGQALSGGEDFDNDGVNDLVVGSPGDSPRERRGGGKAVVLSGADGSEIWRVAKGRGPRARIFVAGWQDGRGVGLQCRNTAGRRRGLRANVLRATVAGELSLASLAANDSVWQASPLIAVAAGRGSGDTRVELYDALRRRKRVAAIDANFVGLETGVNLAAGNVDGTGWDELLMIQSDSNQGDVRVYIHTVIDMSLEGQPSWLNSGMFFAFSNGDSFFGLDVDADGGVAVVADVSSSPGEEIVIGPARGLSLVRVFEADGTQLREWLAYPAPDYSGLAIARGDLDGDGSDEIITVPAVGRPWVKAWNGDGSVYLDPLSGLPVSFYAFDAGYTTGGTVMLADIDADGSDEILVAPGAGHPTEIRAYELDGSPLSAWRRLLPYGPSSSGPLAMVIMGSWPLK